MSKHVISKSSQVARKEQKVVQDVQEDAGPTTTLPEVTWGCLVSSSVVIELSRESYVFGNQESNEDVRLFILY